MSRIARSNTPVIALIPASAMVPASRTTRCPSSSTMAASAMRTKASSSTRSMEAARVTRKFSARTVTPDYVTRRARRKSKAEESLLRATNKIAACRFAGAVAFVDCAPVPFEPARSAKARTRVSAGERKADHACEFRLAVGLGQQVHAGIEPPVMQDRVLGVARGEQCLQAGAALRRGVGQLAAIHRTRHDHVGEQEIDGRIAVDDGQRLGGIGGFE